MIVKGSWLPPLYGPEDTIPHLDACFRLTQGIATGVALVDDQNPCRLIQLSLATYQEWASSSGKAYRVAKALRAVSSSDKRSWILSLTSNELDRLTDAANYVFQGYFDEGLGRYSGNLLVERVALRETCREFSRALSVVDALLEELDHAIAAALSSVR